MTQYTRLVVVGSTRRATMVVPSDEPLAAHLATIADTVEEPHAIARLAVVDDAGQELDTSHGPAELQIADGAVLRLVRAAALPAPPEVLDVTDAVAEARDGHPGAWGSPHRRRAAGVVAGVATAVGLLPAADALPWLAGTVAILIAAACAAAALTGKRDLAAPLLGAAVGAAVAAALPVASAIDADSPPVLVAATAGTAVWLVLIVGAGVRHRAAALGSAIGTALMGGLLLALACGAGSAQASVVLGAVAIAALGVVPGLALAWSGLARLDDHANDGTPPPRATVTVGIAQAYRTKTWSVYALVSVLAVVIASLLATGELWAQLTGGAIAVVMLLRSRVMALAVHIWPVMLAPVLSVALGLVVAGDQTTMVAVASVAALGAVVAGALLPAQHTRIRLRRWGDTIEAIAAIAIVPCAIGVYGVYGTMLGLFS
ncbi:hypothetical protein [Demequina sp. NBRC 110055]|uniref:hypothetical protein n=1 Tax=Demequina sp. NBRC 110055 TaxID=1570344 RepID=UPI000A05F137|nr:hypothetical protein [Demequina sp. NBRC 110055]